MTASKVPKTPMMVIPLPLSEDAEQAKAFARRLSRVTLFDLLHHDGGIEVTESFVKSVRGGWERAYEIKLAFEDHKIIEEAFGITFKQLVSAVKTLFLDRLLALLKAENKRNDGHVNSSNRFLSKVKDPSGRSDAKGGDEEGGDGGDDGDGSPKKSKAKADDALGDDDAEEEEEEAEEADDIEQGTLNFARYKELEGYEDDDEPAPVAATDLEEDYNEVIDGAAGATRTKPDSTLDDILDAATDDEEDNDSSDSDTSNRIKHSTTTPKQSSTLATRLKTTKTKLIPKSKPTLTKSSGTKSDVDVDYNIDESYVKIQVSFSADQRRFLMVQTAERACEMSTIQSTPGITNAYAITTTIDYIEYQAVQLEGVNFDAIWRLSPTTVLMNDLKCNDIYRLLNTYGVEVARLSIVNEIMAVFGSYGIDVNRRHLSLIADYMTRQGGFLAMNRSGMMECSSPFLQMSFESTCTFLTRAATDGFTDSQESPSARIVLGSVPKIGTGSFELLMPLK